MLKIVQKTIGIVLIIFGIPLFIALGFGYWWWNSNSTPVSLEGTKKSFTVQRGDTVSSVAKRLEQEKLIRNELAFRLWHQLSGDELTLQQGNFYISPSMKFEEIAKTLSKAEVSAVKLTFPEGMRAEEYAEILDKSLDDSFNLQDFLKIAKPKEGMLFPDTYEFYKNESAENVVKILTTNFEQKYKSLNGPSSNTDKLDILTLASLVEKEGKTNEDRPVIAGILLNRINGQTETAGLLQVDATLQYAKNERSKTTQAWWPIPLAADKEIESKYNTYKYPGLPPGPIANPGLQSIKAAITPTKSSFLYYIHDETQTAYYARTYNEHMVNIDKYLNN